MKQIVLDSMRVENFRGIKSLDVKFNGNVSVSGSNGTGKTSIYNAYLWCLFNTNYEGKTIEVRPAESYGSQGSDVSYLHHVNTTVELTFHDENGVSFTVKRVEKEDWSTPRGQLEQVYKGQTQERFFNDVPYSVREFEDKIGSICNKRDWFMLSSISAFMSMDTKERRRVLESIFGGVNEQEIASEFPDVLLALQQGKNMKELREQTKVTKNVAKRDLDTIPARLDQQEKLRIDIDVQRYESIKKKAEDNKVLYEKQLDEHLQTRPGSESNEYADRLTEINTQISKAQDDAAKKRMTMLSGVSKAYNDKQAEVGKAFCDVQAAESRLSIAKREAEKAEADLQEATTEWRKENATQYVDNVETVCPTCHRELDPFQVQEIKNKAIEEFNNKKIAKLDEWVKKGTDARKRVDASESTIAELTKQKEDAEAKYNALFAELGTLKAGVDAVDTVETILAADSKYAALLIEKAEVQSKMSAQSADKEAALQQFNKRTSELQILIQSENAAILDATNTLSSVQVNGRIDKEKERLLELQKTLTQTIANCEKIEFEISQFLKKKITMAEQKASEYFSIVSWMLYERNVTNDGEKEICEPIINGCPFSTQNTATQVNAGMDIINGISRGLDISVPMFVDNKESVTELIPTTSQLFTFTVVPGQELTIQ